MKNRLLVWIALVGYLAYFSANAQGAEPKKLLFLTYAGFYKHTSLGPAEEAVTEWGKTGGFDVTTVQGFKSEADKIDVSWLTQEKLNSYDGLMLFTNGNLPFSETQKEAIVNFVKNGKALIGVHCASLTLYDYVPYGEILGAYYMKSIRQNWPGTLKVEDQIHPATRGLGPSWTLVDEFYTFGNQVYDPATPDKNKDSLFGNPILMPFSRDRVHVLLSLDTEKSDISRISFLEKGGDYPQAWCREYGKGRSFYTCLGHRDDIWSTNPQFKDHVTGGIRWALGLEPGDATPGTGKK